MIYCRLIIRGERIPNGPAQGEKMAGLLRESMRLRTISEDRQVEDVSVGVGEHSEKTAVVVRL